MKRSLHRMLQRLGFDLHRYYPDAIAEAQLAGLLRARGFNLVLDVGANTGQFGIKLREHGYQGRIVSFEPLSQPYRQLAALAAGDGRWEVAERAALGEADGEIAIHVSANSYSSSALDMLESHLSAAPGSRYVGEERVPLRRLDGIAAPFLRPDSVTLLKIDTQGFEDKVLAGASGVLPDISAIQIELSLEPLYAGQKLLPEMLDSTRELGFAIWGAWPELLEPRTGRILQMEMILVRAGQEDRPLEPRPSS
jgi:FkbM family methyltransferase